MDASERIKIGEKFMLVDGRTEDFSGKEIKLTGRSHPRSVHPDGTPIEGDVHIDRTAEQDLGDDELDDTGDNGSE